METRAAFFLRGLAPKRRQHAGREFDVGVQQQGVGAGPAGPRPGAGPRPCRSSLRQGSRPAQHVQAVGRGAGRAPRCRRWTGRPPARPAGHAPGAPDPPGSRQHRGLVAGRDEDGDVAKVVASRARGRQQVPVAPGPRGQQEQRHPRPPPPAMASAVSMARRSGDAARALVVVVHTAVGTQGHGHARSGTRAPAPSVRRCAVRAGPPTPPSGGSRRRRSPRWARSRSAPCSWRTWGCDPRRSCPSPRAFTMSW